MGLKKKLIIPALILTLSLVGCSKSNEQTNAVKEVPTIEIQQMVNKSELLAVQPIMETDAKEHWVFEEIKDVIKEGFVIQAMINVKLQDVFVVKTSDVDAVVAAIENYKTNNLRSFGDGYGGEDNIKAVANSVIGTKGDYVYFIATPNAAEIETEILKMFE